MPLRIIDQTLLILIIIIVTIIADRIFLKSSKNLPSILKEESQWKSSRKNFIDFKKYQYNQVFWQSKFQLTFSIFILGVVIILKDFTIEIIGFTFWLVWFFCSTYPLLKFSYIILPRACGNSIKNMKILLEEKN